ncbi:SDR family oxidoreductase [Pararhizobium sp. YC-54]|uniref:SDR family NAD(P)-dependent oxidoreductase n=1 Tax=Pararhizobium sp. YC-54 TaxID=2986920 RepID=UPI0021F7B468|nr:SDR family oxidoreductase [Pararhizobium sp. YC-54]MCW0002152.1 SDR family oxidoreductase [Pararhizobium sp. YC-54]
MRVAVITGGAGGIGAATAQLLLKRGWRVAIVDINIDEVATWPNETENCLYPIQSDVRTKSSAGVVCEQVVERWGRLDLMVNCAGVNRHAPFEKLTLDDWQFVLDVNLTGTFAFMQAAALHMLKNQKGSIVNISSIAGARGVPDRCAYAATKAAIDSITRSAAVGWATRGVRVNAVAPGFTETPLVRRYIDNGNIDINQIHSMTPMQRLASPSEIATAIVFLASEDASFITGQTLYVDGGYMAEYGIPSS